MLAWRLLLATGETGYADDIERSVYNGVLSALSRSGTEFFYVNPLQRRTHRTIEADGHGRRAPWQACACCPPNLMRLLSSWPQYLATSDDLGVHLHQYTSADIRLAVEGGPVEIAIRTDYPWHGRIRSIHIVESPDQPWTLSLRVPGWCESARLTVGTEVASVAAGSVRRQRTWRPGDRVVLELDLPIRRTEPDPRVDAVRGCVAFERGPLVYCIETADLPAGTVLEDLRWDPAGPVTTGPRRDLRRVGGGHHGSGGRPGLGGRRPHRVRHPVLRLGQPRCAQHAGVGALVIRPR